MFLLWFAVAMGFLFSVAVAEHGEAMSVIVLLISLACMFPAGTYSEWWDRNYGYRLVR